MQQHKVFIPRVFWLTGLSGAGKSTTANLLKTEFDKLGVMNYLLDGDILRQGLCNDLGFSEADRYENCRRMAEVAKLFMDEGYLVICASISPYKNMRQMIRKRFSDNQFIEIFVDAPLATCEARDPKGLYKKARAGNISLFTGIDSTYEAPENPEIHLRTDQEKPETCVQKIIAFLKAGSLPSQG
jgi:adenylylsulfate kinase